MATSPPPPQFPKPNSWTYNFVEVSGHYHESSRTWGFHIQCLHYKPVSNHFWLGGVWESKIRWLGIARRKTLKTFVPITSKNSASVLFLRECGAGKAQSAPYIMSPWSPSIIACGLTDCLLSGFQHEQFFTFLFLINAPPSTDGRLIMWHRRHIFQNNFLLYFTGAVWTTNALKI
jgi:hypothetical protein